MTEKQLQIEIIKLQIEFYGLTAQDLGFVTEQQYFDILDGDDFEATKPGYVNDSNDGYKSVLLYRKRGQVSKTNGVADNVIYVLSKPGTNPLEYNFKIVGVKK